MYLQTIICTVFSVLMLAAGLVVFVIYPKLCMLMVKNLRRNLLRTTLTAAVTVAFAFTVTLIWTVVSFLDGAMEEKSQDIKLIVTEKWQLPSQMPLTHASYLDPKHPNFLPELRPYVAPHDFMTWSFYGGSTEQGRMSR